MTITRRRFPTGAGGTSSATSRDKRRRIASSAESPSDALSAPTEVSFSNTFHNLCSAWFKTADGRREIRKNSEFSLK
jgi:hypothetical protein